jgi:hypothetical protein
MRRRRGRRTRRRNRRFPSKLIAAEAQGEGGREDQTTTVRRHLSRAMAPKVPRRLSRRTLAVMEFKKPCHGTVSRVKLITIKLNRERAQEWAWGQYKKMTEFFGMKGAGGHISNLWRRQPAAAPVRRRPAAAAVTSQEKEAGEEKKDADDVEGRSQFKGVEGETARGQKKAEGAGAKAKGGKKGECKSEEAVGEKAEAEKKAESTRLADTGIAPYDKEKALCYLRTLSWANVWPALDAYYNIHKFDLANALWKWETGDPPGWRDVRPRPRRQRPKCSAILH